MPNLLVFTLLLTFASPRSWSASLEFQKNSEKFEDVQTHDIALFKDETQTSETKRVGHGLRKKKIAFIKVRVYVGELYVSKLESFNKSKALDSVSEQNTVVMKMTFLRNVEGANIQGGFQDGLKANGIDPQSSPVKEALEIIKNSGEIKENEAIIVVGQKLATEDAIWIQFGSQPAKKVTGPHGSVKNIFSLWLGKTVDHEAQDMQEQILK